MAQQTQINGNRYAFQNVSLQLAGIDLVRGVLMSINYKPTQQPGNVQGNQVVSMGRTVGYGECTGDFEMLESDANDFNQALVNYAAGQGVTNAPIMTIDFDAVVSYSVDLVSAVITDTLKGCRITGIDNSRSKGTDALTKKYELIIQRCLLNGLSAFGDPNT